MERYKPGNELLDAQNNFVCVDPNQLMGPGQYTTGEYRQVIGGNMPTSADLITQECENLKQMLLDKNARYGDSAFSSGIVFPLSPVVAIQARINDKIARWKNNHSDENEDVENDLLGYIILLRIAKRNERG